MLAHCFIMQAFYFKASWVEEELPLLVFCVNSNTSMFDYYHFLITVFVSFNHNFLALNKLRFLLGNSDTRKSKGFGSYVTVSFHFTLEIWTFYGTFDGTFYGTSGHFIGCVSLSSHLCFFLHSVFAHQIFIVTEK